jgi:hypothetical protein
LFKEGHNPFEVCNFDEPEIWEFTCNLDGLLLVDFCIHCTQCTTEDRPRPRHQDQARPNVTITYTVQTDTNSERERESEREKRVEADMETQVCSCFVFSLLPHSHLSHCARTCFHLFLISIYVHTSSHTHSGPSPAMLHAFFQGEQYGVRRTKGGVRRTIRALFQAHIFGTVLVLQICDIRPLVKNAESLVKLSYRVLGLTLTNSVRHKQRHEKHPFHPFL